MSTPLQDVKDWSRGDLAAVVKKIGGPSIARRLLDYHEVTVIFDEERSKATVGSVKPLRSQVKRLRRAGTVILPKRTSFDPQKFWQTRSGLYVWKEFHSCVAAAAKPVTSLPAREIASFDLIEYATNGQIWCELPQGYLFEDASEFSAHLAGMIERQEGGSDGDLITTGYMNIFYVRGVARRVFSVCVSWSTGSRRWGVSAYDLGDYPWHAGGRTFSRAC